MKNKSQLSMFMVLGIVLLFSFGFLFYVAYYKTASSFKNPIDKDSAAVKELVGHCLMSSVKENAYNGFEFLDLSVPISVKECVDNFESLPNMEITSGNPIAISRINQDRVTVSLDYPITISRGDIKTGLNEFYYSFSTVSKRALPIDNGLVSKDVTLYSSDRRAELFLKQGTAVRDKSGNIVDELDIQMEDVSETLFFNMVDNVAYTIQPDDITFSPPAKIKIRYDPLNYLNIVGIKDFNATQFAKEVKKEDKEFSVEEYPVESLAGIDSVIGKVIMPQELNNSDDDTIEEDETRYSIFRVEEIIKSEEDKQDDLVSADVAVSGSYGVMPKDTVISSDSLNYYTTKYAKVLEKEKDGYRYEIIGYTFDEGIALHEINIKPIDYSIFTTGDIDTRSIEENPELEYEGIAGYLSESPVPSSLPLYSLISLNNLDMVTDTNEKTKSEQYLKTLLYEIISKAAPEVDEYQKGDEVFASIDHGKNFYEELEKATNGAIKNQNDIDKYIDMVNFDNVEVYRYMYSGFLGYISVADTGKNPIYRISSDSVAVHFEMNNSMYIAFENMFDENGNLITGRSVSVIGVLSTVATVACFAAAPTTIGGILGAISIGYTCVTGRPGIEGVADLAQSAAESLSKSDNAVARGIGIGIGAIGKSLGAISEAVSSIGKAIGDAFGLGKESQSKEVNEGGNGKGGGGGGAGPGSGGIGSEGIGEGNTGRGIGNDGSDGGTCFPGTTLILMGNETYNEIKNLKVGEYVMTYNEITKKNEPKKIIKVFKHQYQGNLIKINNVLSATESHPILINSEWSTFNETKIGDKIHKSDSKTIISSIKKNKVKTTVYNIEVEGNHNYYAENILVHNKF